MRMLIIGTESGTKIEQLRDERKRICDRTIADPGSPLSPLVSVNIIHLKQKHRTNYCRKPFKLWSDD